MSWLDRPISQTWYVLVPLLVALAVGIGVVAGCAAEAAAPIDGPPQVMDAKQMHEEIMIARVDVDGRMVTCVVFDSYGAGGVSCDWSKP